MKRKMKVRHTAGRGPGRPRTKGLSLDARIGVATTKAALISTAGEQLASERAAMMAELCTLGDQVAAAKRALTL